MIFSLVFGGEGTGHHLLRALLEDWLDGTGVADKGPHYPLLVQGADTAQSPLPFPLVRRELERCFQIYRQAGFHHVFEDTSFPFGACDPDYRSFVSGGENRGSLRRFDLRQMLQLFSGLGDLRILVLYRSPVSAVHSCLRRGFSNNPAFEVRLAESVQLYLSAQIQLLPDSLYRVAHFQQMLDRPTEFLAALGDWWDIDVDAGEAIRRIRPSAKIEDIPPERRQYLEDFFDAERCSQWLPAYHRNLLLPL